ncbi:MAG TPA: hypothetical protein VGG84_10300 [Gemmatimonadaceae bacterium]
MLNPPARSFVVMRYEVRTPPGMQPEWIARETGEMPENQARQLIEQTLRELEAAGDGFVTGPPIRDPYLVRIEVFETQLTPRAEDTRRAATSAAVVTAAARAELERHLAAGGTVEIGAGDD